MRDLAFLALLVFLTLVAMGLWFGVKWATHSQRKGIKGAQWTVFEYSRSGATHVTLELVTHNGDTLDQREVGQVPDNDPDYDEKLITLRAKAQQRQAVVR